MKIKLFVLCVLVSLAGISCNKNDASAATDGQDKGGAVTVDAPLPDTKDIDPSLITEAVAYLGLLSDAEKTYNVWTHAEDEPEPGSERVTYLGLVDGSPRFAVRRKGALKLLGDEVVELRTDGVYYVSMDLGTLKAPALQLPSAIGVGSTWKSDMTIMLEGEEIESSTILDCRATRFESTTVEAGTYTTLVVQVDAGEAQQPKARNLTIHYAKGVSIVRLELTGVNKQGAPIYFRVELIDDGTRKPPKKEREE
ncbi:MAG: hypothetical protein IH944_03535 [Armatimonadetes bacterium]|nr:hypothetical protein [Armatimonadota bacterium]